MMQHIFVDSDIFYAINDSFTCALPRQVDRVKSWGVAKTKI